MSSTQPSRLTGPRLRGRRWLVRALFTVVAVIGVVAMHGLTMNHNPAMGGVNAVSHGSPSPGGSLVGHELGMPATEASLTDDMGASAPSAATSGLADEAMTATTVERTMGGMLTACVAFLTSFLLLLGVARLLLKVGRHSLELDGRAAVSWFATAVQRLRPDLAELSVLRT